MFRDCIFIQYVMLETRIYLKTTTIKIEKNTNINWLILFKNIEMFLFLNNIRFSLEMKKDIIYT